MLLICFFFVFFYWNHLLSHWHRPVHPTKVGSEHLRVNIALSASRFTPCAPSFLCTTDYTLFTQLKLRLRHLSPQTGRSIVCWRLQRSTTRQGIPQVQHKQHGCYKSSHFNEHPAALAINPSLWDYDQFGV